MYQGLIKKDEIKRDDNHYLFKIFTHLARLSEMCCRFVHKHDWNNKERAPEKCSTQTQRAAIFASRYPHSTAVNNNGRSKFEDDLKYLVEYLPVPTGQTDTMTIDKVCKAAKVSGNAAGSGNDESRTRYYDEYPKSIYQITNFENPRKNLPKLHTEPVLLERLDHELKLNQDWFPHIPNSEYNLFLYTYYTPHAHEIYNPAPTTTKQCTEFIMEYLTAEYSEIHKIRFKVHVGFENWWKKEFKPEEWKPGPPDGYTVEKARSEWCRRLTIQKASTSENYIKNKLKFYKISSEPDVDDKDIYPYPC